MDTLNNKLREAALTISVKHILHSRKQAPEKTAEQLIKLCSEAYGITKLSYMENDFLSVLTEKLAKEDETAVFSWLKNHFSGTSV